VCACVRVRVCVRLCLRVCVFSRYTAVQRAGPLLLPLKNKTKCQRLMSLWIMRLRQYTYNEFSSEENKFNMQHYLATLPFIIMCNFLNIMYNTTSQYYLAILPFIIMCNSPHIMWYFSLLLRHTIGNLFCLLNMLPTVYFSFRLIHCTCIILLILFLCCWYLWATSGKKEILFRFRSESESESESEKNFLRDEFYLILSNKSFKNMSNSSE